MTGADLAAAAANLVGAPFRLHGRDPQTGLDCIGLLGAAMRAGGRPIVLPSGYPLRLSDPARWLPDPAALGFESAAQPFAAGDVVLLRPGAGQLHLAIHAAGRGWIHAHRGRGRVIAERDRPPGCIVHHFRLRGED